MFGISYAVKKNTIAARLMNEMYTKEFVHFIPKKSACRTIKSHYAAVHICADSHYSDVIGKMTGRDSIGSISSTLSEPILVIC